MKDARLFETSQSKTSDVRLPRFSKSTADQKLCVRLSACAILCAASLGATPATRPAEKLRDALDRILADPALSGGTTGAIVERVDTGAVVYTHDADTRLMPASNRKLFTSAAALELLGPGFTFTTKALSEVAPDSTGTLHGDVYLRGVGDSLLAPSDLDAMAKSIAKAGVKRIDGRVVGDGTLFHDGPYGEGWEWDDLSFAYAPQISGLEVTRGVLAVHVAAGKTVGAPVHVTVDPPTQYLPVDCTATTAAKDAKADPCVIARPWEQNRVRVTGTVPLGGHADGVVTVEDPARYAATVFTESLKRYGVTVTSAPATGATPDNATTLQASHTSVPMSDYIAKMNKPSDNLLAESLVRVVGALKGAGGTYLQGHAVETNFFQSLGIDVSNIELYDGCGMARKSVVTPRAVAALLRAMHVKPDWPAYTNSLPIAGVDGDLRNRLKGTKAAGNVHAKTGTLHSVSSLSGYVTGTHGDLYAFSLILNNFPCDADTARAVRDRFVLALAEGL